MLSGISRNFGFTRRRKMSLLLMLTWLSTILRVIIITIISSTDWKTWTMANKIWWGVTYGGPLALGPRRSLETIPFLWWRYKKSLERFSSYFPLQLFRSRYWDGNFGHLTTAPLTVAEAGDRGDDIAAYPARVTHGPSLLAHRGLCVLTLHMLAHPSTLGWEMLS